MNHTPNPWTVKSVINTVGTYNIREITEKHGGLSYADYHREDKANARLISAAPDMLAALLEAKDMYEELLSGECKNSESYKMICDAINRAQMGEI